jgi:hypothetical protein
MEGKDNRAVVYRAIAARISGVNVGAGGAPMLA